MIHAVFFDIDGTLVSFQTHEVSQAVKEALLSLRERGIRIFVATGRGRGDLDVLKDIPFDGYITLNGQYCYTPEADGESSGSAGVPEEDAASSGSGGVHVVYSNIMPREDLVTLLDEIQRDPFPCGFTTDAGKRYNFRDARVDEVNDLTHSEGHPVGDLTHILEEQVYQCIAFVDEERERELMRKMPGSTSSRWFYSFCDISPKGGSKTKGIDRFLEYYGIDLSETMAVGDGGNDRQMLMHVHTAVAMENAEDALKEIADYVTGDADHDGVVQALRRFGLLSGEAMA